MIVPIAARATPENSSTGATLGQGGLTSPDTDAFIDYVYLRDNVAGWMDEHWYHLHGCRHWLTVRRDTRSHEVASVQLAKALGA